MRRFESKAEGKDVVRQVTLKGTVEKIFFCDNYKQ